MSSNPINFIKCAFFTPEARSTMRIDKVNPWITSITIVVRPILMKTHQFMLNERLTKSSRLMLGNLRAWTKLVFGIFSMLLHCYTEMCLKVFGRRTALLHFFWELEPDGWSYVIYTGWASKRKRERAYHTSDNMWIEMTGIVNTVSSLKKYLSAMVQ